MPVSNVFNLTNAALGYLILEIFETTCAKSESGLGALRIARHIMNEGIDDLAFVIYMAKYVTSVFFLTCYLGF